MPGNIQRVEIAGLLVVESFDRLIICHHNWTHEREKANADEFCAGVQGWPVTHQVMKYHKRRVKSSWN